MKRRPAGQPRQRLTVEGLDPNKKYYWAKEIQFRELEEAGYSFTTSNPTLKTGDLKEVAEGTRITKPASRSNDEKLYLMEIPKKWYEENQKQKQDEIDQNEREMFNPDETETSYKVKGTRKEGHAKF